MMIYIILLVILVIPTAIVSYYATISMTNCSRENIAESTLTNFKSITQANEFILFNVVKDVLLPAVLVREHGPFTWGKTPEEAVYHSEC